MLETYSDGKVATYIAIGAMFAGFHLSCLPLERLKKYQEPVKKGDQVPDKRRQVYQIGNFQYRLPTSRRKTWNAALDVVANSYSLTLADSSNGLIATDWDRFYLNKDIFRNKISMRLTTTINKETIITLHNNVERLSRGAAAEFRPVWLPSSDPTAEISRLIKNIAVLLKLDADTESAVTK